MVVVAVARASFVGNKEEGEASSFVEPLRNCLCQHIAFVVEGRRKEEEEEVHLETVHSIHEIDPVA